jgi:hypothetical protein
MFYTHLSVLIPIIYYSPDNGYKNEFLVPTEVYRAVGQHINVSNMIGLQRVRGLWRIYLDNATKIPEVWFV